MLLNYLHAFALSIWGGSLFSFLVTILDLLLIWFFFYLFLVRSKGTNSIHILVGFFLLMALYLLGNILNMRATSWLLSSFFDYLIIIAVIIFKDEIRDILTSFDLFGISNKNMGNTESLSEVEELADALHYMASKKEGALIVIAQKGNPLPFVTGGVELDSLIKKELLLSIFFKNSPLHDGAIVIQENRIIRASAVLPLSTNPDIDPNFGTRHRAAYGISEKVDSIVLVVSEERGQISMIINGQITRNMKRDLIIRVLEKQFSSEKKKSIAEYFPSISRLWRGKR